MLHNSHTSNNYNLVRRIVPSTEFDIKNVIVFQSNQYSIKKKANAGWIRKLTGIQRRLTPSPPPLFRKFEMHFLHSNSAMWTGLRSSACWRGLCFQTFLRPGIVPGPRNVWEQIPQVSLVLTLRRLSSGRTVAVLTLLLPSHMCF